MKGVSTSQKGEIELSKVFSVEPKQMIRRATSSSRKKSSKSDKSRNDEEEIFIDGFILHMFENTKSNVHRHKTIVFIHPHRETCLNWVDNIKARLPSKRLTVWALNIYQSFIQLFSLFFKVYGSSERSLYFSIHFLVRKRPGQFLSIPSPPFCMQLKLVFRSLVITCSFIY